MFFGDFIGITLTCLFVHVNSRDTIIVQDAIATYVIVKEIPVLLK